MANSVGTMAQSIQTVYGLLLRSGLLQPDAVRTLLGRWQGEAGERPADPQRFVAWLVSNKHLTDYQGALLVRGFAEGFFLNEYTILDRLGQGRMAGVYKAQHRLGQLFAIKVLPPSKARDPNLKSRFLREARLALQLRHPNVVRSFQVGESAGLHYLVMEYLEGETLADHIERRGQLPPNEAARLAHQALLGLQHIHSRGLVHRDLKPSNMMLVCPGGIRAGDTLHATVKILDIGLGRQLLEEGPADGETALTTEGVVLGTPDYMAPEQARDARAADIRSDVYSLGCVLYHMLGGRQPFPETNLLSLMIRHATEEPQPLRELNPAVPDALQRVVSRLMAKDPADRYPTPEEAAAAVGPFFQPDTDPPLAPEDDPAMRPYLQWLESVPIPDALPPWLAEMDTVTAAELKRAKDQVADPPRPPTPPRLDKPPRPPDAAGSAAAKTKVVRKIRAVARPARSLGGATPAVVPSASTQASPIAPAPAGRNGPAAQGPEFRPSPAAARPASDLQAAHLASERKIATRRDVLVFAAGTATGAAIATVGWLIARAGR